jgi:riboflavin synthase
MFAGIIQHVGAIVGTESAPRRHGAGGLSHRLTIDLGPLAPGLKLGASVAVDGVCLTVAELAGTSAGFDVVPETWRRTTLRRRKINDLVNLERSLRVGDPIDGHFVQGHVEGLGSVQRLERGDGEWKLWVTVDAALIQTIAPKGSIALDGVSLTVVDVAGNDFSAALIPVTLEWTVLGRRGPGDEVNVETDILARIVLRRLGTVLEPATPGGKGVTWDKLLEGGFAE